MTIKEKLLFFSEHGVSITYIAKRMGVNPSTLTKWLNGQKGITHKNEEKIILTLKDLLKDFQNILGE